MCKRDLLASRTKGKTGAPQPRCFGVEAEDHLGVIDVETGRSTLFMPRLPAEYAVWMGPILPPAHYQ